MRRTTLTLLVVVASLGLPATASATTLFASVDPTRQITLQLDGVDVTHLAAGTYTVIVTDSTSGHNFHLHGPGVDVSTGIGAIESATWTVTFTGGAYGFNCDRHPGSMNGSFTVGDVLSVSRTGTGSGTVTSLPAGIMCGGICSVVFPGPTPVTLTAAPAGGSEFLGWAGACSGIFDCALDVTGYVGVGAQFRKLPPPPPPPGATPPATVKRVAVKRKNGVRTVRITLAVTRHTGGKVVLRRKGSTVVSKRLHVAPGSRLVQLRAPKSAAAGAYVVKLTLIDSVTGSSFVVTRSVKL